MPCKKHVKPEPSTMAAVLGMEDADVEPYLWRN